MKLFLSAMALFLFAMQGSRAQHNRPKAAANTINYTIGFDVENPKITRVSLSFIPKDSVLYMAHGANQLPERWATFVRNMKAVDAQGKTVSVTPMEDAMWKLPPNLREQITVKYELHLEHEAHEWSGGLDGVAYTTDWGVFYTTRALLVFHGNDWSHIHIDFDLPKTWQVTTPWQPSGSDKNSFTAQSHAALMQAMIFAGTHEELSFQKEDFELVFALGGEAVLAEKQTYQDMAAGVLDYYIDLMGGVPNPSPDTVLDKAVVIINSSGITDGEVIGNNISILVEENGGPMSKMISKFIFAHEFFHLWNGKSFTPEGEDAEWFKEGFTNYYTLKALYHIGFLDDTAYFQVLNNLFYQRYRQDEGVGKLAMVQGEEKHAHWGLIYGGGLFVAIAQDMIIRKATGNTKNLDHLMKSFFMTYGGTTKRYTLNDIRNRLSDLSAQDQSDFFMTYVEGTTPLPIADYLSLAGLDAKIEENALLISKKDTATALEQEMVKGFLGISEEP